MTDKPRFERERVKLGDVAKLVMGQSPASSSYNSDGNGLPFYQGNADFGKKHPTPKSWCTEPKKIAEAGDILLSVRAPVGAINIANEKCCIGRGLAAIRTNFHGISCGFLALVLQSRLAYLEAVSTGSTFKSIGRQALAACEVPLYPFEIQGQIVLQFNGIDSCLHNARVRLALLDALVKSRFVEMFGDPINQPRYQKQPIDKLAKVSSGATPSRKRRDYYEGTIPWVKTGEVAQGTIQSAEEHITKEAVANSSCHILPAGTILIAMYGQGDTRGKASLLAIDAATNQACAALEFGQSIDSIYALTHLQLCYEDIRGLSLGGNQKNLSLQIVKGYELEVPPLPLQQEFADFVAQVDKSRFVLSRNLRILN